VIARAGVERGRVFFANSDRQWAKFEDPVAWRFEDRLPELLRAHGRVRQQPFLLCPDGLPDFRVNGF
jgi:hypothetical protein